MAQKASWAPIPAASNQIATLATSILTCGESQKAEYFISEENHRKKEKEELELVNSKLFIDFLGGDDVGEHGCAVDEAADVPGYVSDLAHHRPEKPRLCDFRHHGEWHPQHQSSEAGQAEVDG